MTAQIIENWTGRVPCLPCLSNLLDSPDPAAGVPGARYRMKHHESLAVTSPLDAEGCVLVGVTVFHVKLSGKPTARPRRTPA